VFILCLFIFFAVFRQVRTDDFVVFILLETVHMLKVKSLILLLLMWDFSKTFHAGKPKHTVAYWAKHVSLCIQYVSLNQGWL